MMPSHAHDHPPPPLPFYFVMEIRQPSKRGGRGVLNPRTPPPPISILSGLILIDSRPRRTSPPSNLLRLKARPHWPTEPNQTVVDFVPLYLRLSMTDQSLQKKTQPCHTLRLHSCSFNEGERFCLILLNLSLVI